MLLGETLGFGIGSGLAGIAGVLTAYQQTVLQISTWDALSGIGNVSLLFLGGVGHIGGAMIGAALTPAGILSTTSSEGQILRTTASGALMIAIAIFQIRWSNLNNRPDQGKTTESQGLS